jgi:YNFM family putative membrane transporter
VFWNVGGWPGVVGMVGALFIVAIVIAFWLSRQEA